MVTVLNTKSWVARYQGFNQPGFYAFGVAKPPNRPDEERDDEYLNHDLEEEIDEPPASKPQQQVQQQENDEIHLHSFLDHGDDDDDDEINIQLGR